MSFSSINGSNGQNLKTLLSLATSGSNNAMQQANNGFTKSTRKTDGFKSGGQNKQVIQVLSALNDTLKTMSGKPSTSQPQTNLKTSSLGSKTTNSFVKGLALEKIGQGLQDGSITPEQISTGLKSLGSQKGNLSLASSNTGTSDLAKALGIKSGGEAKFCAKCLGNQGIGSNAKSGGGNTQQLITLLTALKTIIDTLQKMMGHRNKNGITTTPNNPLGNGSGGLQNAGDHGLSDNTSTPSGAGAVTKKKIAKLAKKLVGVREDQGSNKGKVVSRLLKIAGSSPGQPWCTAGCSALAQVSGVNIKTASTAAMRSQSEKEGANVKDVNQLTIGMFVMRSRKGGGHSGTVIEKQGNKVAVMECNSSDQAKVKWYDAAGFFGTWNWGAADPGKMAARNGAEQQNAAEDTRTGGQFTESEAKLKGYVSNTPEGNMYGEAGNTTDKVT